MSERERDWERETRPHKTHDYQYRYRGYWTAGGVCRIRVYQAGERPPIVIASELAENANTSITNMVEYLVAEIIARHFPDRFEHDEPVVWIEQYPRGVGKERETLPEFSLATFASYTPRLTTLGGVERVKLGEPTWRHMDRADLARLLGLAEDELD